jgi:hypothetical protein
MDRVKVTVAARHDSRAQLDNHAPRCSQPLLLFAFQWFYLFGGDSNPVLREGNFIERMYFITSRRGFDPGRKIRAQCREPGHQYEFRTGNTAHPSCVKHRSAMIRLQ